MVQNKRHKPQGGRRRTTKKKKGDWLFVKLLGTVVIIFAVAFGIFRALGAWNAKDISMPELFTTQEEQTLPADFDGNGLLDVKAPESIDEQFVIYKGFNVSFNTKHRIPNYVVYELTNTEVEGEEARAKSFRRDENVDNCPEPYDYTRSGYDRGHMAPAADMKWDNEAMRESFYMTNICPQKHALNGGGWKRWAIQCRLSAKEWPCHRVSSKWCWHRMQSLCVPSASCIRTMADKRWWNARPSAWTAWNQSRDLTSSTTCPTMWKMK